MAYVNKFSWLLEDDYNRNDLHRSTEYEALSLILEILSSSFRIEHIKDIKIIPFYFIN